MTDPVTAYAEAVSAGTTVAGPPVRAACQRHLRDLGRADLRFDPAAAQRVLDFFPEVLRLPKGNHAGEPFHLLPWQQFLVGSLYGWLGPDGRRRFRRAYVETGRGTGKSPLAAGLLLYAITADGEHAAEAYCVARNADQALITFRLAAQIRDLSPALTDRVQKYGGERPTRLVHHDSWSFAERTTTSDTGAGKSGLNPHLVIVDEYHEHKTSTMMDRRRLAVDRSGHVGPRRGRGPGRGVGGGGPLRGRTRSEPDAGSQAVAKAGVMTINEGRRLLRLPPVPDGDRLLQPKGAPTQTTTKETA